MKLLDKITLFINESDLYLSEGRKPFYVTHSAQDILQYINNKYSDKKSGYNYVNMLRKRAIADDDHKLAYKFSEVLKKLGYEAKPNARGVKSNLIAAAQEVHKNIKRVLGYTPAKRNGDFTEAEKKRIEQYVRTRYKNLDATEFHKILSQLKDEKDIK